MKSIWNLALPIVKWNIRRKRRKLVNPNVTGQQITVPRDQKAGVDVILYHPEQAVKPYPALFNVHGGAWVGCDASMQDSFCREMSNRCGCTVVNINYTKLDIQPFPYPQEEIRDTVLWFAEHAQQYDLDNRCFSLLGYSAGGHLCAGASILLEQAGFSPVSAVLAYPFLDFSGWGEPDSKNGLSVMMDNLFFSNVSKKDPVISPGAADDAILKMLPPVTLIVCGQDPLKEQADVFKKRMEAVGLKTCYLEYPDAIHGFLEVNRPEYKEDVAKSPQQAAIARKCEEALTLNLLSCWDHAKKASESD